MMKIFRILILVCLVAISTPAAAGDFTIVVGEKTLNFKMIEEMILPTDPPKHKQKYSLEYDQLRLDLTVVDRRITIVQGSWELIELLATYGKLEELKEKVMGAKWL